MAKREKARRPTRRSRGEIDRNYFFGDVLIKTGVAGAVVLALASLYAPFSLFDAVNMGRTDYLIVLGVFGALCSLAFLAGRHLRHEATHWDFD